jgi:hypothetical protein
MVNVADGSKGQTNCQSHLLRWWRAAGGGRSIWRTHTGLLVLLLTACVFGSFPWQLAAVEAGPRASLPKGYPAPTVTVRAASQATIRFRTQNGERVGGVPPEMWDLPHLVHQRNGALTDPRERTLLVEVTGIDVPQAGVTVTLSVETQHGDPDTHTDTLPRIQVWRESQWITNTTGLTQTGVTVVLKRVFDETLLTAAGTIATPTDYFRYDLTLIDAQHPAASPRHTLSRDYAFLMENQWVAPLPEVREASAGAAPDELVVYYCDMFPVRRDNDSPATWLPRERVEGYIRAELIPAIIQAYRVQTDVWAFPWYEEWSSYRSGRDAERLSVALTEEETWFHGEAPGQGHAGISLNVSQDKLEYDSLTDGLMSIFHHELFHSHQRNIYQHYGGDGRVGGAKNAWDFFAEGTAVLASAVGQPDVEFSQTQGLRAYTFNARVFVGRAGESQGELNRSYEHMYPYHAVAYWRFLYEQCGGMSEKMEDPAAGMQVIRQALNVLYAGDVVDIGASTDLVENMPAIMTQVLEDSSCPFKTYEDSLQAFARAIYALRLEEGRCTAPGFPRGCGFYDPHDLYAEPPHSTLLYTGEALSHSKLSQPYPAGIPSSFGMDFVDVALDPSLDGQSLNLEFHSARGGEAEFVVQVWSLMLPGDGSRPRPASAEILTAKNSDGHLFYVIPAINTAECNRLGLAITRIDAKESLDPDGAYTVVLHP